MVFPSNTLEGDNNISNTNINENTKTKTIINTDTIDDNNGYTKDENVIIEKEEEENASEITRMAETEAEVQAETKTESSLKISPDATEIDETEEKYLEFDSSEKVEEEKYPEVDSSEKAEEEKILEFDSPEKAEEEKSIKVEIVEVDKVNTLNYETFNPENENLPNNNDFGYGNTVINQELDTNRDTHENENKTPLEPINSEITEIRSDNGLWWLYAKPKTVNGSVRKEEKTLTVKSDDGEKKLVRNEKENIQNNIENVNVPESEVPVIKSDNEKENTDNEGIKEKEVEEEKKDFKIKMDEKQNTQFNVSKNDDINYSTLYIIFPFSENYIIDEKYIDIIPNNKNNIKVINEELNVIKENSKNYYNENYKNLYKYNNNILSSLKVKNIYLYKVNMLLSNNNWESLKIKLKNSYYQSLTFNIKRGDQIFLYWEFDNWYSSLFKENEMKKLNILQRFTIFKYYLIFNKNKKYIPLLLNQFIDELYKSKKIEMDFILEILFTLLDDKQTISELPENLQIMFKDVILSLKSKELIPITNNCDERYRSIVDIIENYNTDSDEELNLYSNLLNLILINSFHFNDEKFNENFCRIQLKDKAIKFIKEHKNCFKNLHSKNLEVLFYYATLESKIKFQDILSLAANFNEYLNFYCLSGEYIINENPKIDYSKIPLSDETTEINLLIPFIEIVIKLLENNNLSNKSLEKIFDNIKNLISKLDKKDLKKLYELKEIAENYKVDNSIKDKINFAIHNTGKMYIENNKFTNSEIIDFIHEDAKNYPGAYKTNSEYTKLIAYINLNEVDDEFCYKFNTSNDHFYNYKNLFDYSYDVFINSIVNCATNFHQLKVIFKIFDIENTIEFVDLDNNKKPKDHIFPIIGVLINHIAGLDRNGITTEELGSILGMLFKLISDYDNYKLNVLFKTIKHKFSIKEIKEIFAYILFSQNERLNDNVVKRLVENMDDLSSDNVITYLNQFENSKIQEMLLQKLDKNIVSEDELFNENLSDNLNTLLALINMNYFDENNDDLNKINYIDKTRKNMNYIVENLKQYDFSMKQLKLMYSIDHNKMDSDKDNLKNRLYIISLGKSSVADNLYQLLNRKINECVEIYGKIEEIIANFNYYYSRDKRDVIEFYKKLKEEIIENPISEFPDLHQLESKDFEKLYVEAHGISRLKISKFFTEIYEINKKKSLNESDSIIFENTEEKFFHLKNLFDEATENNVDLEFLEEVIKKINNDEMENEIEKLMDICEIDGPLTNHITEKLILLNNKNRTITLLKNIIKLLCDFKPKDCTLQKYIKTIIDKLEKKSSLMFLRRAYKYLYRLNLNIMNSDLYNEIQGVINEMYAKPELMKFIIDKKIENIHQMGEFIDDIEDIYITLSDIDKLESCMAFIQELKNNSSLSENKFLDKFIEIIEENKFKDIGIKFKDVSGKYGDIYELYTNHLNPNELNKVHIELIYKYSSFDIQYTNSEYICKTNYKGKDNKPFSKNFDEMLDLRDIALLRKKDQKKEYFKICDGFAEIITDIQEIINLLNIIDSKGYFEELNYFIDVKNGNTLGYLKNEEKYEGKNLNEIIKELKNINKSQNDEIKDTYESYPVARLLYGRQFKNLYNYITPNNNINYFNNASFIPTVKNILKYATNNKINKNIRIPIKEESLKQMFKNINYYLNLLFSINNIDLNSIYQNAILKYKTKRGLYTQSCSKEEIECDAIRCSLNLTGNFPLAQTVLYCNSNTSEDELISFIYKSIKCDSRALFIIMKPETLTIEMKRLLIDMLKEHYSPEEIKSCLLVLYTRENKTSDVITEIEKISYYKYSDIKIREEKEENLNKKSPNVEIYSSEISGLGKSTKIKNDFINELGNDYEYVYFPLGDYINTDEIILRLLDLTDRKIALHLDLCSSNNIELIRELLFKLLILKHLSNKNNIFYYGNEIRIKVEIPNGFIDFNSLFPILKFFKNINITSENIPPLIVSNDINSDVQIVCNYLKHIDSINRKDMYIEGIIESSYDSSVHIMAIPLSQKECQDLIFHNLNIENPNYYQIESFIKIVAEQLRLFTVSCYLNVDQLNHTQRFKRNSNLNEIRKFFVESLIKTTKHFITSSYDNIIKGQNVTYGQQQGRIDPKKANERANEILTNKKPFSIKDIRPSIVLINEDGQSISEIVTFKKNTEEYYQNIEEYNLLKAIYNSDSMSESRDIIDYTELKHTGFLIEARKVLNLYNKLNENEDGFTLEKDGKRLRYLEDIVNSYVFTEDNFIKLLLISLRLRANIPVVMMGETGCGKTSLIKIIAELKGIDMHILNIHAGIEDKDIINFLEENELFEDNEYEIRNDDEKKEDDIWVFLDEINTCNSLGLITEIMLKHTCKGKNIKSNAKFIAACNPYRLDTKEKEIIGLYDETKHMDRNLVYNVNPLPPSLLNFVFDFKTPEKEDIKRYISNIVLKTLKESIHDDNELNEIKPIAENSLFDAHEFIKNEYDISSVSLREIRRWEILFKWFIQFLKKPFFEKEYKFTNNDIYKYSLNLSIYLCYFMRIFKKNKRSQFMDKMKETFGDDYDFEKFPKLIQNIIADAIELDKGIAKNRPILENLFAIFVCLNTKIPLFIVGKPGCSKTLSAQLVFKSMNGKDSFNEFFKEFPKVYTKSYQGSLNSNSAGIKKIFNKARNSLNEKLSIISAIFFDELGLAEISNNNPLKVIHSELEYDDNKRKVSFIGISNWPLDASKMNRGIYLSIPEPDENDLITTALTIAESYGSGLKQNYNHHLENLALSYFEYKNELKQYPYKFESRSVLNHKLKVKKNINEFHGTRDFYHLIKIFCNLIIEAKYPLETQKIEDILCRSIERNFGGLENSVKIFKEVFLKHDSDFKADIKKEYDVIECVKSNIMHFKSRYLLLITNSPIDQFLVSLILNQLGKKQTLYYGSRFEDDISRGHYTAKVLNKIQVTMSNEIVMILKDLESLYPSLYDFFNQNFRKVGESQYARIALGNSNTQNYYVNDKLKCIILLDKNKIHEQDPPFINRFEKHFISFEYLLNTKQIEILKKIHKIINDFIKVEKTDPLKINLKYELINCNLEEFQGLNYELSKTNDFHYCNDDIDDIEQQIKLFIFQKIVPTFSQDIIFYLRNSSFSQKYIDEFKTILDIYHKDEHQHKNIKSYLENIDTNKHIIYTFSNIFDSVFDNNEIIRNNKYDSFIKTNTKNIYIKQYKSERDIENEISEFYNNENNNNLCILHFSSKECIHLRHINYLIENNETQYNDNNNNDLIEKVIIIIIHLKRIPFDNENSKVDDNKPLVKNNDKKINNEDLISYLSKWKHFFIDNLNGMNINIREICESSNTDLFNNEKLINLDDEFKKDLFHAYTFISYNYKINFSSIKNEEYIEKVCEYINSNVNLKNIIQNLIKTKINNIEESILLKIYSDYIFEDDDVDFISIIIKYVKSVYNEALINTLIQLEENHVLSTILLETDDFKIEYFKTIYHQFISKFDSKYKKFSDSSNTQKIDLILGITYPFIISIFKTINAYIISLRNDYIKNEENLKFELCNKNDYDYRKNLLEDNLKTEFEKYYIGEIFKENNQTNLFENNSTKQNLIKILFNDYIIYYLSKYNINFNNRNILNFFYFLYQLYINLGDNNIVDDGQMIITIKDLTKFVLFIESYKDYIYPLCEYICIMDLHFNNFINDFISTFSSKTFKNNDINISCISYDIFYNLFESFVNCILTKQDFNEKSEKTLNQIIKEIKTISERIMKINSELSLTLKQILYLNNFVLVTNFIIESKIPLKEKLQEYYDILKTENETYLLNKKKKGFKIGKRKNDPIDEEFLFLKDNFSNLKNYTKLIVGVLQNEMKISKNEKYREKLIGIICSNDTLIINSKTIFDFIFKRFNVCPINKTRDIPEDSIYDNEDDEDDENIFSENENDEGENIEAINDENDDNETIYDNGDSYGDNDETGLIFLTKLKKEKNNSIIKNINKTNSTCLDEILLSLFDKEFLKYFNMKKSDENLIFNQSLLIFKKCIDYIEKEKNKINNNNKIGFLYCISYIKYYCYHFSRIIYNDKENELHIHEIIRFLNTPSNFRNVIKIYIFKILNKVVIGNYKETVDFIKRKQLFYNEFDFNEKIPCSLEYLFIQNNTFNNYMKLRKEFINSKNRNFNSTKNISNTIHENDDNENNMTFTFYDLMVNEEISHLKTHFDEDYFNNLSHNIESVINELNLSTLSKNILNIYINSDSIKRELPIIATQSLSTFEMLLYAHKFAFICSFSKPNSVYSNILSPNVLKNLNHIYIPGGEPNDNLLIKSGDQINDGLRNKPTDAIYKCSCHYWYYINNDPGNGCGFPVQTSVCKICGKLIGGTGHKLVERPGHVRIYYSREIKQNDRYKFEVPYMYLNQLMDEVNKERNIQIRGLKKVKKDFYIDNDKKVRNVGMITYRILSFIFYSCIYYDSKLGYLNSNDLKKFYYSDATNYNSSILSIMNDNWKSLKEELKIKGIENIQSFLNIIIPKLSNVIIENSKGLQIPKERDEFEIKCNNIINQIISNNVISEYYKNNHNTFIANNNTILNIKDDTIKSIIQETSDVNQLSYKIYPLIKYFNVVNYPNENDFNRKFKLIPERQEKYPVITSYLNAIQDKKNSINSISEIFNLITPFTNYVIEKYNNKISRQEAKNKIIEDELKDDVCMKTLFKSFQKGWKKIYKKLPNYDCHGEMKPKWISKTDYLAYVLNDRYEDDYGKYIATAFKLIITSQNEFLTPLISDENRIIVQKANSKDIVTLQIENDNFDSFEDIICTFFFNRINNYSKNGRNVVNYQNGKYDFDAIENELSKILLSGKKLLKEEKQQEFINYAFETFNQDETLITRFKEKVKKTEQLSNEEKTCLTHKIKGIDYKKIIFNLQSLLLYFTNYKNIKGDESLTKLVKNIPRNVFKLDDEFETIFQNDFDIKLNKLIDCYEHVESINFSKILKNVPKNIALSDEEFKNLNLEEYINAYADLKQEQINELNNHFEKKDLLINKRELIEAIRKYISRYMVSETFKKFNENIFEEIRYKSELWKDSIVSENNESKFEDEIDQLTKIGIKFGQIISLYNQLNSEKINHNQKSRNKNNNNRRISQMMKGKRRLDY